MEIICWAIGNMGYLLNWVLKAVLVLLGIRYLWREYQRASSIPQFLSDNVIVVATILCASILTASGIDHAYHGKADLVLTCASLAIVAAIVDVKCPQVPLGVVLAGCLLMLCSRGFYGIDMVWEKCSHAEVVRFNDRFSYCLATTGDSALWRRFHKEFRKHIPDAGNRRIWVIDTTSFLHYFLNTPVRVKHTFPIAGLIGPNVPGYDEYVNRLRDQYFDFIIVGEDGLLFGRKDRADLRKDLLRPRQMYPATRNKELLRLIRSGYTISAEIQAPGGAPAYKIWKANRLQ